MAQLVEHGTSNVRVVGSIPTGATIMKMYALSTLSPSGEVGLINDSHVNVKLLHDSAELFPDVQLSVDIHSYGDN